MDKISIDIFFISIILGRELWTTDVPASVALMNVVKIPAISTR